MGKEITQLFRTDNLKNLEGRALHSADVDITFYINQCRNYTLSLLFLASYFSAEAIPKTWSCLLKTVFVYTRVKCYLHSASWF